MPEKIKVLMIGPDQQMQGGVSTVVNNYYAAGIEQYVDVTYLSTISDGSKFAKLWWAVKSSASFSAAYKHYNLLHIHMAANASFIRKALLVKKAYKAGIPILIQEHGGDFNSFYDRLDENERKTVKDIFSMADRVIALSEEWKEFFGNGICDPRKIVVMHNGVIVPEKGIEDYKSHNVLFLGRICKEKGIYDLLDVIPRILKSVPDAHFYLCGDGEMDLVKERVKAFGIEKSVMLPGWVRGKEKDEIIGKCETLVLPSYYEGMPMVVLEAMSYGYAVIATNVGGTRQIIDGENGVLIQAGDKDDLEGQLIRVLSTTTTRASYGTKARKTIEDRFNLRKSLEGLYRQYTEVLDGKTAKTNRGGVHVSTLSLLKMMRKI